jgi:hypothetical protein
VFVRVKNTNSDILGVNVDPTIINPDTLWDDHSLS